MLWRLLRALPQLATLMLCGVSASAQAPRAARALPRGVTLSASDIVAGVCASSCAQAGWVTRKVIAAGETLVPPAVSAPMIIVAGDSVDVVRKVGAAALTVRGVAVSHAAAGESLTVQLPWGGRVPALAVKPGEVNVP